MGIGGISNTSMQQANYYATKTNLRNKQEAMQPNLPDSVKEANLQKDMKVEELKGKEVKNEFKQEECQTCENRKYQDGSDDNGVSYQTPTHISPSAASGAVRAHENEHVTREQAKADREDREVVSQSVQIHTGVCPECGKVYVSGGTTTTTTASKVKAAYSVGLEASENYSANA